MPKYQIKITLLSDLCVSDGSVYNSMLDTDICYDELGFPYIPAKRLKGNLRECALEANDWGAEIPIQKLFGDGVHNSSALRLGNAYLEDYEEMKDKVLKNRNSLVCHPQNVLNHFSHIRMQTAIDNETGASDAASLRSMRVANKGLVFIGEAECPKQYYEQVSCCCRILKHMGIARTRGLGEVQLCLNPDESLEHRENQKNHGYVQHACYQEGSDCLSYELTLMEPLICKSVNGGESRTLDYIEGNKILGLIVQQLKNQKEEPTEFLNMGEIFCSNAYLSVDGKRFLETPASCFSVKNNDQIFINRTYETEETKVEEAGLRRQLKQMKHGYVWFDEKGNLERHDVRIEQRYHHRRPEDKSIGRAVENEGDDSMFYQMASIVEGQSFQGYITGTPEQIKKAYMLLSQHFQYYMGYSRSAEYGKITLRITDVFLRKQHSFENCKSFMVKLESPAIIYNENAMYSINPEDLIEEVNAALGTEAKCVKKFINYTTVGGFQVTWNARKPVVEAFDKGTVLLYELPEPMNFEVSQVLIGERVMEGFGEVSITSFTQQNDFYERKLLKTAKEERKAALNVENSQFLVSICNDLFHTYLRMDASYHAGQSSLEPIEAVKPTVSNMLLMCTECHTLEEIEETVQKRFQKKSEQKNNKLQAAERICREVRASSQNILKNFCDMYGISGYTFDRNQYECEYMAAYLNELKYRFRKVKGEA